jgi:phage protein D/phage baseplate assembly protein gpV
MAQQLANAFVIEVDGAAVGADANLLSVVVDDALHLPDLFAITFRDPGRDLLTKVRAKVGARVKVQVRNDAEPAPVLLLDGEVTAVEAVIDSAGRVVIVRGYDLSHRLHRGRTTVGYHNVTHADVAVTVAKRVGLKPGTIEPTSPVHDHVAQVDQSDAELLDALAAEVGYEVVVEGDRLHFRKPTRAAGSASGVDLSHDEPLDLIVGSSLVRLHAAVRAAGQVAEIEARGWDTTTKKALMSRAPVEATTSVTGITPADLAAPFGSPSWTVPALRLGTQAEVDREAKVVAHGVGGSMTELEGTARGNPRLRPGACVKVALAGAPFDGSHVLTSVRHAFDPIDGYLSHFTVSGTEDRSLLSLGTVGRGRGAGSGGVAPAVVDDVDDPDHSCRVRLRFPWLHEDYVTDWVRTVQLGAGDRRGFAWLPDAGDEVLVAFEEGDLARPYVVGGLYNGVDAPLEAPKVDAATRAVDTRQIVSRAGHRITFTDSDGAEGIEITTGGGAATVVLDETGRTIEVRSEGDVSITAEGALRLDARGHLTLHGASVAIDADSTLDLTGGSVTSVKGSVVQLN